MSFVIILDNGACRRLGDKRRKSEAQVCCIEKILFLLIWTLYSRLVVCALASPSQLEGIRVLITAPPSYAPRLASHLESAGARVILLPTIVTEFLSDDTTLRKTLLNQGRTTPPPDYVAFTSRRGIQAALRACRKEKLVNRFNKRVMQPIALGVDAEALSSAGVDHSFILTPEKTPTPQGIVELLCALVKPSERHHTRILCPIPLVSGGLTEPPVVPNFLQSLHDEGFVHVEAVHAYETSWTGPSAAAEEILTNADTVNVIAISSTAEAEGLLLLCQHYGVTLKTKIAVHGPVTASGVEALGLDVDAVSQDSSSFRGMCHAVAQCTRKGVE